VAMIDRDEIQGRAVCSQIQATGQTCEFFPADVKSEADVARTIELIAARFHRIDHVINNAGIVLIKEVEDCSTAEWDNVFDVNVKSIFLMSRLVIPIMAEGGGGSIINTASGWGLAGGPRAAAYCASKGAVVLLTKAMAIDHGPQKIRVNCICPGDTDTGMLRDEARQLGASEDVFFADSARRPLGRLGKPEEIAQAALYLASDASSFVTGAALVVDGGGLAGSA